MARRHALEECSSAQPEKERTPWFYGKLGGEEAAWGVATGTLHTLRYNARFRNHIHVGDTRDGGAASWLESPSRFFAPRSFSGSGINYYNGKEDSSPICISYKKTSQPAPSGDDQLQAHCQCGDVKFHITRPNTASVCIKDASIPDILPANITDIQKHWWLWEK
jgi:hypothetical protein